MRRQSTKKCANCPEFVARPCYTYCSIRCRVSHLRRPVEERLWAKVIKTDTCWLWQGARSDFGHGYIAIGGRGDGRIGVHHLSYTLHFGAVPDGLWVLHRCDIPNCVRPDHLFVGTRQDNIDDMVAKGRGARGAANGAAKLTESDVRLIRDLLEGGEGPTAIGRRFGVTDKVVRQIHRGQTWRHVV